MKAFIRTYFFSFFSAFATQILVSGFEHTGFIDSPFIIFVLGLSLTEFFIFPLLRILALPRKGLGGLLMRAVLSGLVMYICTAIIAGFSVTSTVLPGIRIIDIVLPAKELNPAMSLGASALTYSIVFGLLGWLCDNTR